MRKMALRAGIEIEAYNLSGRELESILESEGCTMGGADDYGGFEYHAGRSPQSDGLNGAWCSKTHGLHFTVNSDGSLNNQVEATMTRKGAFELITPILHGEKEFRMLARIIKKMRKAGAYVKRDCGTHMNFGINHLARVKRMSDRSKTEIGTRIVEIYSHFQPVFDAISPNCRRSDSPDMAYRLSWQEAVPSNPFRGRCVVNMVNHSDFIMYGRVEFRQPGYTLEHEKMMGWLRLLNSVVSCAVNLDHPSYRKSLHGVPQTLQGFVDFLNPGVKAERWAHARIGALYATFENFQDERAAVLGLEGC
jgi:hypothetical protein